MFNLGLPARRKKRGEVDELLCSKVGESKNLVRNGRCHLQLQLLPSSRYKGEKGVRASKGKTEGSSNSKAKTSTKMDEKKKRTCGRGYEDKLDASKYLRKRYKTKKGGKLRRIQKDEVW